MALTGKQMLFKCCGIYCSLLACIGIYFFTVMSIFQGMNNRYMVWMLEKINDKDMDNTANHNFLISFIVVIFLNIACCLGCGFCGMSIKDPEEYYDDDKVEQ